MYWDISTGSLDILSLIWIMGYCGACLPIIMEFWLKFDTLDFVSQVPSLGIDHYTLKFLPLFRVNYAGSMSCDSTIFGKIYPCHNDFHHFPEKSPFDILCIFGSFLYCEIGHLLIDATIILARDQHNLPGSM